MSSKRILVVDGTADMRHCLRGLLERFWSVEAVEDGAKALASARARRPDLILADVVMPGLDDLELVRELRRNDDTATIPVILLSPRAGEDANVDAMGAGADDYVVKPFGARELLARDAAPTSKRPSRQVSITI